MPIFTIYDIFSSVVNIFASILAYFGFLGHHFSINWHFLDINLDCIGKFYLNSSPCIRDPIAPAHFPNLATPSAETSSPSLHKQTHSQQSPSDVIVFPCFQAVSASRSDDLQHPDLCQHSDISDDSDCNRFVTGNSCNSRNNIAFDDCICVAESLYAKEGAA